MGFEGPGFGEQKDNFEKPLLGAEQFLERIEEIPVSDLTEEQREKLKETIRKYRESA